MHKSQITRHYYVPATFLLDTSAWGYVPDPLPSLARFLLGGSGDETSLIYIVSDCLLLVTGFQLSCDHNNMYAHISVLPFSNHALLELKYSCIVNKCKKIINEEL